MSSGARFFVGSSRLKQENRTKGSKGDLPVVEIFTDGACLGNPGPGGYAAILKFGPQEKEISGCTARTTNNRMELTAVIEGLRRLKRPCKVTVITDSNYVVKGMTEWMDGWKRRNWLNSKKQPVLNKDLWEQLLQSARPHLIQWKWVKGHEGHQQNERCDQLAKHAIDKCRDHGGTHP